MEDAGGGFAWLGRCTPALADVEEDDGEDKKEREEVDTLKVLNSDGRATDVVALRFPLRAVGLVPNRP
jgi:hypothetical protein